MSVALTSLSPRFYRADTLAISVPGESAVASFSQGLKAGSGHTPALSSASFLRWSRSRAPGPPASTLSSRYFRWASFDGQRPKVLVSETPGPPLLASDETMEPRGLGNVLGQVPVSAEPLRCLTPDAPWQWPAGQAALSFSLHF